MDQGIFSKENGWIIDFEPIATDKIIDNLDSISTLPWFEAIAIEVIKGVGKNGKRALLL